MDLSPAMVTAVSIASAAFLVLSLAGIVVILIRLPKDYFKRKRLPFLERIRRNNWAANLLLIGKSVAGLLLLVAGVFMLALPGQGILTILAGLVILEYPYKHAVERSLVRRKSVHRSINWLRRKFNAEPLVV